MSDEKRYTEREVVRRERAAHIAGQKDAIDVLRSGDRSRDEFFDVTAARRYPLPKITRALVRTSLFGSDYKWEADKLWKRHPCETVWVEIADSNTIRDVILNPTEEVGDNG